MKNRYDDEPENVIYVVLRTRQAFVYDIPEALDEEKSGSSQEDENKAPEDNLKTNAASSEAAASATTPAFPYLVWDRSQAGPLPEGEPDDQHE